jgi:hypothetical protein
VAEPDDEIPKINPSEVETLIKKIEQTTLSEQDKRMVTRLLRPLLYVVGLLQEKEGHAAEAQGTGFYSQG